MWSISQQPTNDWFTFLSEFHTYEAKVCLKDKEDTLLDIYSLWLRTHDDSLKVKIISLAREIEQIEPQISFDELIKNLEKVKVKAIN